MRIWENSFFQSIHVNWHRNTIYLACNWKSWQFNGEFIWFTLGQACTGRTDKPPAGRVRGVLSRSIWFNDPDMLSTLKGILMSQTDSGNSSTALPFTQWVTKLSYLLGKEIHSLESGVGLEATLQCLLEQACHIQQAHPFQMTNSPSVYRQEFQ